jgi:hypothetical protein
MRCTRIDENSWRYRGVRISRGSEKPGKFGAFIVWFGGRDKAWVTTLGQAEQTIDKKLGTEV